MELLLPDPQLNWIRPPVRDFDRFAAGWRPDVILVSGPPFSGFVVAATLARRFRVPWVADYRDLWSVGNDHWYGRRCAEPSTSGWNAGCCVPWRRA
ncbi:glycosyltransferase [Micromonospora sp. BRA006-A]|nr:glycosyltransferase [Micromonospora sp. BRA006-A]